MKLVTMIVDARDRVHLAAVRAPDLLRREIAETCGGAALAYVAVPPAGVAAEDVVARVAARFAAVASPHQGRTQATLQVIGADPKRVRARLVAEQALGPLAERLRRALLRPLRRLASHLRRRLRR